MCRENFCSRAAHIKCAAKRGIDLAIPRAREKRDVRQLSSRIIELLNQ
jgi:hypothetical protein